MQYVKHSTYNGVPEPDETVDEQHLDRFTNEETLEFFRSLGGTEKVIHRADGSIKVRSVSPDRSTTRVTTFTPKAS